MLKASVVIRRPRGVKTRTHQYPSWYQPVASLIIDPQSAVGGGTPTPRNDSDASATIASGISNVAYTMTWAITFGRMSTNMIRHGPAPSALAASMNSLPFIEITWPRTIRAG